MDARSYLNQARVIDAKIQAKRDEITKIESLLLQGVSFEEKVGTSSGNKNERIIFHLMELKDELNRQLMELVDKQVEIMETIDKLQSGPEIAILHKRYLQFKTFQVIADEVGYSTRQVYRIHDDAVLHIQQFVIECHNNNV